MSRISHDALLQSKRSRWALLILFGATTATCFFLVGVTAWVGGDWQFGVMSVSNPSLRLVLGASSLICWYVVWLKRPGVSLPWKTITFRFVLVVLGLGVSFSCAEWVFRRCLQGSQGFGTLEMLRAYEKDGVITPHSRHPVAELITLSSNHRLIYELRPDMDMPYGEYHVYSNKDGLREMHDFKKPKPAGVRRILGIGDSGMFGWDVPQEENYLASLERALAKRSDYVFEVLNGGVPGYNAQQEIEWLATKGLAFEPNIVVVGWCGNDYDAPFFLYQPVQFMDFGESLLLHLLFQREHLAKVTKPHVLIYSDLERSGIHADVLSGMGECGVRRAFIHLRELGTAHGFKVLVFGPMDALAVALCRELGLLFFNTYERIPVDSIPTEFKVHDMHPTDEGHALLASHLERELDCLGWLKE